MHSPMKQAKKTRKNTFSQVAVAQTEVGDFQGGYFVMTDATSTKENDCPYKSRPHNKLERSPGRRKHQTNESNAPSSPNKERHSKFENDLKKPFADVKTRTEQLPGGFLASPTKKAPASPKQLHLENYDQKYSKDSLSSSPPSSGRWAGPAFGNAPHPSSLPLPEFPPMSIQAVSTPSHMSQDSYLSKSPPTHDGAFHGMVYQPHPHFLSSSPPPSQSSIPAIPFSYVGIHQFPQAPLPAPSPSLAQLSTDLRRMLNINGSAVSTPVVMVSANSC